MEAFKERFLFVNANYVNKYYKRGEETIKQKRKPSKQGKLIQHIPSKHRGLLQKHKLSPRDEIKEKFWPFGKRQLNTKEAIHVLFALIGFMCSILMMVEAAVENSWPLQTRLLIYISGWTALISCPVVVYNQTKLTLLGSFRQILNGLRDDRTRLASENEKISMIIDDLEKSTDRLLELNNTFASIARKQGFEQDELLGLVLQNRKINKKLEDTLQAAALQRVMGTMFDADRDKDFIFTGPEIDILIVGLQHIEEIEIDEEEFRQVIMDCDGSFAAVYAIVKQLIMEEEDLEAANEAEERKSEINGLRKSVQVVKLDKVMAHHRSTIPNTTIQC